MSYLLLTIGIGLVVATLYDFLSSTITTRGAGPIITPVASLLWRLLRHVGVLRRYAGPLILVASAVLWIVGSWAGWSLIFIANAEDLIVTGQETGQETGQGTGVSAMDKVAFVVSLLSTLGLGVLTPTTMPWHLASGLAAVNGMVVLTLSVSYVLSVMQTAVSTRALAFRVEALGVTPDDILVHGWDGAGFDPLVARLSELSPAVVTLSQQMQSYPLSTYFNRADDDLHLLETSLRLRSVLRVLRAELEPQRSAGRLALQELTLALDALIAAAALPTDDLRIPPSDPTALGRAGLRLTRGSTSS